MPKVYLSNKVNDKISLGSIKNFAVVSPYDGLKGHQY